MLVLIISPQMCVICTWIEYTNIYIYMYIYIFYTSSRWFQPIQKTKTSTSYLFPQIRNDNKKINMSMATWLWPWESHQIMSQTFNFYQGYFQGPPGGSPLWVSFPYYSHIFRDSYGRFYQPKQTQPQTLQRGSSSPPFFGAPQKDGWNPPNDSTANPDTGQM